MEDLLGYAGKRTVVTGAASGIGAATAKLLGDVGAEVIGIDVKDVDGVAVSIATDLRDRGAIDDAVTRVGGAVDAVFSVAGLPGAPFSDLDTMLVNFVGARHLIESLVPSMGSGSAIVCVASIGGLGWEQGYESLAPLVTSDGFDAGKAWCEANAEAIATTTPYIFSKQIVNAWVAYRSVGLVQQGIRLNCLNPGPTSTAMMPAFEAQHGADLIDAFIGPGGRRSEAEEQAWPLLFMNSPRATYLAGHSLANDNGFSAALATGQFEARLPSDVAGGAR